MTETYSCKLCGYDTADRKDKSVDNKTEFKAHLLFWHLLDPRNPFKKPIHVGEKPE